MGLLDSNIRPFLFTASSEPIVVTRNLSNDTGVIFDYTNSMNHEWLKITILPEVVNKELVNFAIRTYVDSSTHIKGMFYDENGAVRFNIKDTTECYNYNDDNIRGFTMYVPIKNVPRVLMRQNTKPSTSNSTKIIYSAFNGEPSCVKLKPVQCIADFQFTMVEGTTSYGSSSIQQFFDNPSIFKFIYAEMVCQTATGGATETTATLEGFYLIDKPTSYNRANLVTVPSRAIVTLNNAREGVSEMVENICMKGYRPIVNVPNPVDGNVITVKLFGVR